MMRYSLIQLKREKLRLFTLLIGVTVSLRGKKILKDCFQNNAIDLTKLINLKLLFQREFIQVRPRLHIVCKG